MSVIPNIPRIEQSGRDLKANIVHCHMTVINDDWMVLSWEFRLRDPGSIIVFFLSHTTTLLNM